ncbi:MAG: 3-dehydroquinate synthase [Ferruginibacter sp.]|nr:3-dehydroquinate synthase [Ferruginibacter sp.]
MRVKEIVFSGKKTGFYLDASFDYLDKLVSREKTILLTDKNIFLSHQRLFDGWETIVIEAGEQHKQQSTVDEIIHQLIEKEADRSSVLVGVGGGVVTDITGFVAGIYMRGLSFGFVPTTLLAMVDAAIGGKNGIDAGLFKNLIGLIRQPQFLLYDYSLLKTLPDQEWANGFAEIIKHACIKKQGMFESLNKHSIEYYKNNHGALASLVEENVIIKTTVVQNDEFEQGERRLLNFGHTLGHAIENIYALPHGFAISIGMMCAARFSETIKGFKPSDTLQLKALFEKYTLPTSFSFDKEKIWGLMKLDKKRAGSTMRYILLESIGNGVAHDIPLSQLEELIAGIS